MKTKKKVSKYNPPKKCEGCESVVKNIWKHNTDWYGVLYYGDCHCGRVVDQGHGWEPAAP